MSVKIKSGFMHNGEGKGFTTLADALDEQAKCDACGCNKCYGYETITSWNSTTGERTVLARYYVNGVEKIDTIENAITEIKGYQAL